MRRCWFLSLFIAGLSANPSNLTVVAGEAVCAETGSLLEIHVSDRAVINWDSFSIRSDEMTKFIQPNSQSVVLNRVVGQEASLINGHLFANGIVYLVNPQGIVIGPQGRIDTAAFIGSSLEIDWEKLLKNEPMWVRGDSMGSIVHLGKIEAREGNVSLFARRIESRGETIAPNGSVQLLAGHEILLQPDGKADLFIRLDASADCALEHTGQIDAIEAKLALDGPQTLAIGKTGMIEARSVVYEGGRVFLRAKGSVRQSGLVNVSGVTGGTIEVVGSEIYHDGTSLADGGGSIAIQTDGIYLEPESSYLSVLGGGKIDIEAKGGALCSGTRVGEVTLKADRIFSFSSSLHFPLDNGNLLVADERRLYLFDEPRTRFLASVDRKEVGSFGSLLAGGAVPVLTVTAANDLLLNADITNSGADITVSAGNNLTLTNCLITSTDGNILALAGVDMIADAASGFQTTDTTSTITLVADNNFPSAPEIGPGTFQLDPMTVICTNNCAAGGGFVQLYTAQTNPSFYPLLINNEIAPAADLQSLMVYYPDGNEGIPYHIYYKGSEPVPAPSRRVNIVIEQGVAIVEPLNESTETTENSLQQNSSAPDPRKTCRVPNVSVKVGG